MNDKNLDPVNLFYECLRNPEPLFDKYYSFDKLIISESSSAKPTPIMLTNQEIIKRLTAAEMALEDKQNDIFEKQIEKIRGLLTEEDVNFIEFTSFWPCIDVSFSSYRNLSTSEKIEFLREVAKIYIEKRHRIYSSHGYTPTSIQIRKDFEKHKGSGSLGFYKAAKLLKEAGFNEYESMDFLEKNKVYCKADNNFGTSILRKLKREFGLRFVWQAVHQNKYPDMIFCGKNKKIFILEMKHMKETGGGQDKQMAELISFVKEEESERRISYVAFLDGVYFNELISPSSDKIKRQKEQILEYLKANKENANYFVNSYGFWRLITSV